MVGEVVVVFDWLEGCGLAEEAEVVGGDGGGEEGLDCWRWKLVSVSVEGRYWDWKLES